MLAVRGRSAVRSTGGMRELLVVVALAAAGLLLAGLVGLTDWYHRPDRPAPIVEIIVPDGIARQP
jgi:hypothetical protein